jgi:hypothetical protein
VKDAALKFKTMMTAFAKTEKMEYEEALSSTQAEVPRSDIDHEKSVMRYLYTNKDAFVLLTRKAQGSSYESFYHETVKYMEQLFSEFVGLYHCKTAADSVMQNAIHYMVTFRIHVYMELLESDISLEEALAQAEIIASYSVGGFENVMKHINAKYT